MPIAIGAFFALDAVIVAFVLTLWFFSTIVMLRPVVTFLARLLSEVPVVGDSLASAVVSLEDSIANWIQGLIRDAYQAGARPVIEMMDTYANAHSGDAYSQRLVASRLTSAVITASDAAHNRVNPPTQTYVGDTSTVNNTYVTNYVDNVTTVSETYTDTSYDQLATWANGAVQSVYADVVDSDSRIDRVADYAHTALLSAQDYANTVAAGVKDDAIATANDYTLASFGTIETYITQVRDYATQQADSAVATAEDFVTTHEDALRTDLTAAMTGVAAIATTVATDFAKFKTDCGDPLCDGLLDFAKHMGGLKKLLETGLLIGFLVDVVTDPEGAADAAIAVEKTVTAPAVALYHSIFGE